MFLPVKADDSGLDVFLQTMFACQIAVATEDDMLAIDYNDAMQDVELRAYFCQDGVSHLQTVRLCQQCLVAIVFQERTHAEPTKRERHGVPLFD